MKQLLRKGLKHIVVDDVPDPVVTPHHVLVRPIYSLISSGTETASIHQEAVLKAVVDNPSQLGKIWNVLKVQGPVSTFAEVKAKFSEYAVLGYSGAGIIVDKHGTATNLEIGDRVAYGGEGTGHGETILVGSNLVVPVPESVPFEHACFATLGSIALNSVRIAELGIGETVAVLGLGLVGQLIVQLAKLQGATVLAVDLKEQRVQLARQMGVDHALLGGSTLVEHVSSITGGRGVDCVIVAAAAKSSAPCQQAVQISADRGRIVDVGAVDLAFPWYDMYRKEIQFFMARAYGPGSYDPVYEKQGRDYPINYVRWTENRNMAEFLRLVSLGRINLAPLITHRFPLADAPKAYETIMSPSSSSLAVLLNYPAADSADVVGDFRPTRQVETPARRSPQSGATGVALVGAGNLARWVHLPNLKKVPMTRLRAIYSGSGVRGKSYALRFGADYCSSEYEQILKDPDVGVVVIVSRNSEHAAQALQALRAGKHVFVEKPMALTIDQCRELRQAVAETGNHLTVGFNRRFSPTYLGVRSQLARRRGPAVLNLRVNSPGISGDYWMADPATGGAILGEACHFVDLAYWLLESEPVVVSAFSLPTGKGEPIGENNLTATFRFADGSIANFTYCTVGSKTSGGERVETFAPGMGAVAEDFKRLTVKTNLVSRRASWFAEKGYAEQLRAFFDDIRVGKAPGVTVEDGARATILCLKMLESARTMSPCELDWKSALVAPLPLPEPASLAP
ncbi:MAG TPA: bi-domain-containing oxidoreductase [Terriglobales bacterium]|nr:bi-domain-containing oxidoreductase [Terriglobales bacterium]